MYGEKKETCTHVKGKKKLQTCIVCMCEVRPCTERDKRKQTTNMHEVGMCSVRPCTKREKKTGDEREKRKQPPNIYACGVCGVRLSAVGSASHAQPVLAFDFGVKIAAAVFFKCCAKLARVLPSATSSAGTDGGAIAV